MSRNRSASSSPTTARRVPPRSPRRVAFLDTMRGFAVIVMVFGHSIDSVLSTAIRTTDGFRLYDALRGFTGPMFLFISGFAFAIVTLRRWETYRQGGPAVTKRVTKMLLLLAFGYFLHAPFFSLSKIVTGTRPEEYAQMFQVDVLHCLAVSILLLQGLIMLARTPGRFIAATAVLTVSIILLSPITWSLDVSGLPSIVAPYLSMSVPSIFPLFPYAAYLLAGVLGGALYQRVAEQGKESRFAKVMLVVAFAAVITGFLGDSIPFSIYPDYDAWKAGPLMFLIRLGTIMLVCTGFYFLRRIPERLSTHLVLLGRSSLVVYTVHLVIVYGSVVSPGLMQIVGQTLPVSGALIVAACVLMAMVLLVRGWVYVTQEHHIRVRLVLASLSSTILYLFLTNPY